MKTGAAHDSALRGSLPTWAFPPAIDVVQDYPAAWDWRLMIVYAAAAILGLLLL